MASLDPRYPAIRKKIQAQSAQVARLQRDILEQADNALWTALRAGADAQTAWQHFDAQLALQRALRMETFPDRPLEQMTRDERMVGFRNTITALKWLMPDDPQTEEEITDTATAIRLNEHPVWKATLPPSKRPSRTLSDAFRQHIEDSRLANRDKSEQQQRKWRERRERAVRTFIAVHGSDPAMDALTRADALQFSEYWRARIMDENLSSDMARKDFASLRAIYKSHFDRLGDHGRMNIFHGLSFPKDQRSQRLPFSPEWVRDRFLHGSSWQGLNDEARDVLLVLIETGARPSEICNLVPEAIRLVDPVPHIVIASRQGRAIKAKSSRRAVPLVGVALAGMQRHPQGFPRYLDREDALSATLMKHIRAHSLRENEKQSVYSLRHGYIDRIRAAGVGDDLRRGIVGHSVGDSHGGYGRGFPLQQKADVMQSIILPFDPEIFS